MARLFAHPFTLARGRVLTVEAGSDEQVRQAIAVLATTRRGERQMVPALGVVNPDLPRLDLGELNAQLSLYGPPGVTVTGLTLTEAGPGTLRGLLAYTDDDEAALL